MEHIIKKKKQVDIAFRMYDKDGDGYITKTEMAQLSSRNLSKAQVDKVRMDGRRDGRWKVINMLVVPGV